MKSYFPKQLFLSGVVLALSFSFLRAQADGPYYLSGPPTICASAGCGITFSIQSYELGGLSQIASAHWGLLSTGNMDIVEIVNYDANLCGSNPPPGMQNIWVEITTISGEVYYTSMDFHVVACDGPKTLTSDASQHCPAATLQPLFPPLPPLPPGFALLISDAPDIASGEEFCLEVRTRGFYDILGMQFSLAYDPTVLQFLAPSNVNLNGLSASSFGNPSPGVITMTWNDPQVEGITRPDSTVIFKLCFRALEGACASEVVFSNTPTPIQILSGSLDEIEFHSKPGRVQVIGAVSNGGPAAVNPSCCEKVCAGSTVRYTASIGGTDAFFPIQWLVYGGANYSTSEENPAAIDVEWNEPGRSRIRTIFGGLDFYNCVDVIALPEVSFSTDPVADGDTLRVCQGQSVAFSSTSQGASTYQWDFGNDHTSTEPNTVNTWNSAGIYRMMLIGYNDCLCSDTAFLNVVVSPAIAPEITCRGTVCEGSAVTYTTDADCGTFVWEISANGIITDGGGPTDDFITIDWISGGEGYVQLQVENCAQNNFCAAANRMRVPVISEHAEVIGPEQVCRAELVTYSLPLFGGVEYTWTTSSMGTIQSGQNTNAVTVQWANAYNTQPQWVAVEYYNCYLECGGVDTLWVNIRPEFYISGSAEVCFDDAITASAIRRDNFSSVLCSWEIQASDGSTLWTSTTNSASPTISWTYGAGNFTLIARAVNPGNYCNSVYEKPVRVLEDVPPLTGIDGAIDICPVFYHDYEAQGILPDHRVYWTIIGNDANPSSETEIGPVVNVQWNGPQPYTLRAIQREPHGCPSDPIEIHPVPIPALAVTGEAEVCAGQITTYSVPDFSALDYFWNIVPADAGAILYTVDSNTISVLWHKAGPAFVTMSSCGQNALFPVTVHPKPDPQVAHPDYLCPGETALVQTTGSYASYSWRNEAGDEVAASAMPSLPFGYYQVSVTNDFGCSSDVRFHIEGYPSPDISISTPDNTGLCVGSPPSTFYALDTEEGYTYRWLLDGNTIPGAQGVTLTSAQLGDYRVEVTDHNGCKALSNELTLFAYCGNGGNGGFPGGFPGGAPGSGGGPGGTDTLSCDPNTLIQFDIQPGSACDFSSYTANVQGPLFAGLVWDFGDPDSGVANSSSLPNPSHTFTRAGFFPVYLFGQIADPEPHLCYAVQIDTVPLAANFYFEQACAGAEVLFFDASTFLPIESIVSWQWNFGDPASGAANTSNLKDPVHAYGTAGSYTITLVVTAASGCSASMTRQVEAFPLPSAYFDPPVVACAATISVFEAQVANEVVEVQWDFGDPTSGAANTADLVQAFHRYETAGTYTAQLQATTIYGCTGHFSRDLSMMPNTLSGSISFTTPICEGDSSLLTTPPGGTSWAWSTGDTTPTIWAREKGTYSVVVSNDNGCQYKPANIFVNVFPMPQATMRAIRYNEDGLLQGYVYDTLSVCSGEDVFLEVIEMAGHSYVWSDSHPGTTLEFSEERGNLLSEGEHEIFVTVTNNSTGCYHIEGPFRIIVRPLPAIPVIAAMPAGPVCEGTLVTMNIGNPQPNTGYLWSSGEVGPFIQTTRSGQYQVTAVNEWGCENTSEPHAILPGPDINLVPSGCHTRCRPDTLCFPSVPGVVSYQWFFNGAPQGPVSATAPQITVTESGAYVLSMTTDQGCSLDSDPLVLELYDGFGSIGGQVYWDRNNNNQLDAADSLLANLSFVLASGSTLLDTFISQPNGHFTFPDLLLGDYTLHLNPDQLPAGLSADSLRLDTALRGCNENLVLNWPVHCIASTTAVSLRACSGETTDYNGIALAANTVTDFVLTNAFGCDSVVTVTVNALTTSAATIALSICPGETANYNGTPLLAGTTTNFTLTNAAGCDSVVTVTVNALATSASEVVLQACPNGVAIYNGVELAAGTVTDFVFTNAVGCDSVVTVTVIGIATSTGSLTLTACPGTQAIYNGVSLAPGTVMDFTLTNAAGCDSILTVTVNAGVTSALTLPLQACPDGQIAYQGQSLAPGTNTDFLYTNAVGCDSVVTVVVTAFAFPEFQLASSGSCPGNPTGSITVTGGQGLTGYALNQAPMQATGLFENLPPDAYEIMVEDLNGCRQTGTIQVAAFPPLQMVLANTVFPCNAESLSLEVFPISGDDGSLQFLWENGLTTAQRTVEAAGEYWLTTINNCDTLVQQVLVQYESSPDNTPFYIPNGFSPNGDGVNDVFQIFASDDVIVQSFELMIFDRWGNQLFYTKDIAEGWNGFFRGRVLDQGVFVWWLNAQVFHCGQTMVVKKKGDVTIVR